jgi:hypothetical protein
VFFPVRKRRRDSGVAATLPQDRARSQDPFSALSRAWPCECRSPRRASRSCRPRLFDGSSDQAFSYCLLARQLACAADSLGLFPRRFFRRLLVKSPALHLPENAFTLHFLFQGTECLINVVVANEHLQSFDPSRFRVIGNGVRSRTSRFPLNWSVSRLRSCSKSRSGHRVLPPSYAGRNP